MYMYPGGRQGEHNSEEEDHTHIFEAMIIGL